jgi:hypothetical protein
LKVENINVDTEINSVKELHSREKNLVPKYKENNRYHPCISRLRTGGWICLM